MGRHGGKKQRFNPLIIGLTVAAVVLVVGLGWWWWSLRSSTDPVSADPVQAYATVTESGPCTVAGSTTTVDMNTSDGVVSTTLKICGYRVDQSILVEYLRTDPSQARVFGTSTAPATSVIQKLLPIAILLLGVIAAGAALAMLRERRKPRSATPVSVAELRAARLAESAEGAPGNSRSATATAAETDSAVPPDVTSTATAFESTTDAPTVVASEVAPGAETPPAPTTDAVGNAPTAAIGHADHEYAPSPGNDVAAQPVSLTKADTSASYDDDLFGSTGTAQNSDR